MLAARYLGQRQQGVFQAAPRRRRPTSFAAKLPCKLLGGSTVLKAADSTNPSPLFARPTTRQPRPWSLRHGISAPPCTLDPVLGTSPPRRYLRPPLGQESEERLCDIVDGYLFWRQRPRTGRPSGPCLPKARRGWARRGLGGWLDFSGARGLAGAPLACEGLPWAPATLLLRTADGRAAVSQYSCQSFCRGNRIACFSVMAM